MTFKFPNPTLPSLSLPVHSRLPVNTLPPPSPNCPSSHRTPDAGADAGTVQGCDSASLRQMPGHFFPLDFCLAINGSTRLIPLPAPEIFPMDLPFSPHSLTCKATRGPRGSHYIVTTTLIPRALDTRHLYVPYSLRFVIFVNGT